MIDAPTYRRLVEESWTRPLTLAERTEVREFLKDHPEFHQEWAMELALNRAFDQLSPAPVASNFTSVVLRRLETEQLSTRRQKFVWPSFLGHFWPRLAFGAVLVTSGMVGFHEARAIRRGQMTQSLAVVSRVSAVPSPEILLNYDAINALNRNPAPDEQLLSVLQ
jgi:anti-sigma factor RsiW